MANGFTFGGEHSSTWSLKVTKKKVPLMPPMKDQYQSVAGRDGVWDFGTQFDSRTIEIDVVILADSKTDMQTKLRNLVGAFNPRLGAKELIFDDEPDKMFYARLTGQLPIDQIGFFGTFTLQLICTDPFTYSATERNVSGGLPLNVTHNGTHVAKPVLVITKNSGAATLTNTHPDATTETLTFETTSPSGVYTVDCKEFTILRSGAGAYKYVSGDFFSLYEGTNTLSATGGITNVQVTFRDTWL